MESRYQPIEGKLVTLPPEPESNDFVADNLQFLLAISQLVPHQLIGSHTK